MIRRIRTGTFTHVIVWKIDRISRNIIDFTEMFEEFHMLDVTFIRPCLKKDRKSAKSTKWQWMRDKRRREKRRRACHNAWQFCETI